MHARNVVVYVVTTLLVLSVLSAGAFGTGVASAAIVDPDAPIATPDQYAVPNDQTLTIAAPGFLENDVDPNGDTITGQTLVDDVDNGTLAANTDGSFTYTPNTGFVGTDSFTYSIVDPDGNSDTTTVTIEVLPAANRPPVGVDDHYTVFAGDTLSITAPGFLENDVDPDGDAVTGQTLVDDVDNGALAANTDGQFTYTPDTGFVGTDSFTYSVIDGSGNSDTVTVTIEVLPATNRSPVAVDDEYAVIQDQTLSITAPGFLENDVDPDGDAVTGQTLVDDVDNGALAANTNGQFTYTPDTGFVGTDSFTYSMTDSSGNTDTATVTIEVITPGTTPVAVDDWYAVPNDQTLSITAPGFLENDVDRDGETLTGQTLVDDVDNGALAANTDGQFTYTPDTGFVGTDSFTYSMTDASGNTDTATVTIEVLPAANRPPVGTPDWYAVPSDQTLSITAPGFLENDVDPDGDTVTGQTLVDDVDNGALAANTDGQFTYTPNTGFVGTDSFTYSVIDPDGNSDTTTVTIEVLPAANRPPVGVDDHYTVFAGDTLSITAPGFLENDVDPDGDTVTGQTLVDDVDNGALAANTDGSFTYTPDTGFVGTDSFTYSVIDGSGNSDTVTVTIEVVAVNTPPEVTATADPVDEGDTATVSVSFTDPDVSAGDTHSAVIDWGDGTSDTLSVVTSPFAPTHVYGDDGVYTVTVTVTDSLDASDTTTTTVTVANLAPSAAIDGDDIVVGTVGGSTAVSASATDPGSDDLTFDWSTGDSTTYFNDGTGPDPDLSPGGTFPFTAADTTTAPLTTIGVSTVDLTVTDDDTGQATDSVTVLTVGDADATRTQGFWGQQYSGKGKAQYDEATLEAFLDITGVTSDVFSEQVPATTIEEADAVLGPSPAPKKGAGGSEAAELREKATAQLLAAWLNFAAGGVAWDEPIDTGVEGVGTAPFYEVVSEAEAILLDADATHADLERAKDLAEAINTHNEE